MEAIWTSRLQFTAVTMLHSLFVPFTLVPSIMPAVMGNRYAKKREDVCLRTAKFWGTFFLINVALGFFTGITLNLHLGKSWPDCSVFVVFICGFLPAIEAIPVIVRDSKLNGVWTSVEKGFQ